MGAGISSWGLAREVSSLGQLGVVSGTAIDAILVRRLWDGDPHGDYRRAIAAFPRQDIAQAVLDRYLRIDGPGAGAAPASQDDDDGDSDGTEAGEATQGRRYKLSPMLRATITPERQALIVLANFVEVFLAKEGHDGVVGINYLEKIQFPTLPSLYGAMLADVDAIIMGAGIPIEIPGALDLLSRHLQASISLDVLGAGDRKFELTFDPQALGFGKGEPDLRRPQFLPIISAAVLAKALLRKSPDGIAGFIVEGPIAGGHNAPPRGPLHLNERGEPVYGERDVVDLEQMKSFGLPFWLAGAYGSRQRFAEALAAGAHGVQVGTAFAFCEESGLEPKLRAQFLSDLVLGKADVYTDPVASPTGFPFKVASLGGSLSEQAAYEARPRLCDIGYLRRAYVRPDGKLDYRCPSEPVEDYLKKGGKLEDTVGRKCLCNALVANIGMAQRRPDGYEELPMLTSGDDIACILAFVTPEHQAYHARDVIEALLPPEARVPSA
jgi:Dioxygenases related to 2-nitropropane dioxygenase